MQKKPTVFASSTQIFHTVIQKGKLNEACPAGILIPGFGSRPMDLPILKLQLGKQAQGAVWGSVVLNSRF